MNQILAITRKELRGYFGSPMAVIFIGAFLAATLFTFFWVAAFFARGIADVRPLFQWTPVLLIFLVAALTMRQWSEEQRVGTLEILLTLPVSTVQLVLGKFLAVVALVALALALTLFLPVTVALLGNLDWGPVFGGYLASILLAAAYAAIGLAISSRTDNQIVALISTVLFCGMFYLVGSAGVTDFAGQRVGERFAQFLPVGLFIDFGFRLEDGPVLAEIGHPCLPDTCRPVFRYAGRFPNSYYRGFPQNPQLTFRECSA